MQPAVLSPTVDLTRGSVLRHIVRLSIPSMLTSALESSYHAVDTYFVAQLGTVAQAAMGVFGYFFMILLVFNQIIGIGSVTFIARSFGAKRLEETRTVIGQTFIFKIIAALCVTVIGYLHIKEMYLLFGSERAVAEMGTDYGRIIFLGMPLFYAGATLKTSFRGIGDMVKPLVITAVAVAMNLFLDWMLIFGNLGAPAMGIKGAAVASVIAQTWTLAAGLTVFLCGWTNLRMSLKNFASVSVGWMWRILRVGVPAAIGENAIFLGHTTIGWVINQMGTAVMAANAIVWPVLSLMWIPTWGLQTAVTTMVGQNLGAKKPERSGRSVEIGLGIGMVVGVILTAVMFALAGAIVGLFAKEQAVLTLGTAIMRIYVFAMLTWTAVFIISSAYWGSGDTKPPMIISVLTMWGLQVPLVFWLVYWQRVSILLIWYIGVATAVIDLALVWLIFRSGRWKRVRV